MPSVESNTDRSKAYSAATARLREGHRQEFDGYLTEEMAKFGLVYTPKPTEAEKAKSEIEKLLALHPELRNLFAIGNDPGTPAAPDNGQPGAVQRSEVIADAAGGADRG
jgi:hypothetical protein